MRVLIALTTLLAWTGVAHALPSGDELVDATLVSDAAAVEPGGKVWLGVQLDIEPKWHVYWQNPGDAGLATDVRWTLPDGYEAGPLRWPLPHRYLDPGDITSYGYADSVMLLTQVNVPDDATPGQTVTFTAEVNWLVCKAFCLPGEATVRVDVKVGPRVESDQHANIHRAVERLPGKGDGDGSFTMRTTSGPEGRTQVTVHWSDAAAVAVDLYPIPTGNQNVTAIAVESGGRTTQATVDVEALDASAPGGRGPTLKALLVWRVDPNGQRQGVYLDVPLHD